MAAIPKPNPHTEGLIQQFDRIHLPNDPAWRLPYETFIVYVAHWFGRNTSISFKVAREIADVIAVRHTIQAAASGPDLRKLADQIRAMSADDQAKFLTYLVNPTL